MNDQEKNYYNYIVPAFLGVLIFASNFLKHKSF